MERIEIGRLVLQMQMKNNVIENSPPRHGYAWWFGTTIGVATCQIALISPTHWVLNFTKTAARGFTSFHDIPSLIRNTFTHTFTSAVAGACAAWVIFTCLLAFTAQRGSGAPKRLSLIWTTVAGIPVSFTYSHYGQSWQFIVACIACFLLLLYPAKKISSYSFDDWEGWHPSIVSRALHPIDRNRPSRHFIPTYIASPTDMSYLSSDFSPGNNYRRRESGPKKWWYRPLEEEVFGNLSQVEEWSDLKLKGIYGSHAYFANKDLENVDFSKSYLNFATFEDAILCDVNFAECDLRGAIFSGASLRGVNFEGADLRGASFIGIKEADFMFDSATRLAAHNGDWLFMPRRDWKTLRVSLKLVKKDRLPNAARYINECQARADVPPKWWKIPPAISLPALVDSSFLAQLQGLEPFPSIDHLGKGVRVVEENYSHFICLK